jgi:hypothetical protein
VVLKYIAEGKELGGARDNAGIVSDVSNRPRRRTAVYHGSGLRARKEAVDWQRRLGGLHRQSRRVMRVTCFALFGLDKDPNVACMCMCRHLPMHVWSVFTSKHMIKESTISSMYALHAWATSLSASV